jgi:hypothetical protein
VLLKYGSAPNEQQQQPFNLYLNLNEASSSINGKVSTPSSLCFSPSQTVPADMWFSLASRRPTSAPFSFATHLSFLSSSDFRELG